jgi:hypothetical protein
MLDRHTFVPDMAAALWAAEGMRPFAAVKDPGLERLINSVLKLHGASGTYKPPSDDAIAARVKALRVNTFQKV